MEVAQKAAFWLPHPGPETALRYLQSQPESPYQGWQKNKWQDPKLMRLAATMQQRLRSNNPQL